MRERSHALACSTRSGGSGRVHEDATHSRPHRSAQGSARNQCHSPERPGTAAACAATSAEAT
eukprot:7377824-Prymnesium_polylepis.1